MRKGTTASILRRFERAQEDLIRATCPRISAADPVWLRPVPVLRPVLLARPLTATVAERAVVIH